MGMVLKGEDVIPDGAQRSRLIDMVPAPLADPAEDDINIGKNIGKMCIEATRYQEWKRPGDPKYPTREMLLQRITALKKAPPFRII